MNDDMMKFAMAAAAACAAACAVVCAAAWAAAPKKAMVIVEPREHPKLEAVLRNFDERVPGEYSLIVFHGASAGAFAREAAKRAVTSGRGVRLVRLGTDNLTADEYNRLFKTRWFWDRIDAEHVLVFQTDAAACGGAPRRLAEFEAYGYVGCAYDDQAGPGTHWDEHAFWGSGGLSMRRKSAALSCLRAHPGAADNGVPEDVFFSDCVQEGHGRRPEDARVLAAWCTQNSHLDSSWGAHRLHDQLDPSHAGGFLAYCPEAAHLMDG